VEDGRWKGKRVGRRKIVRGEEKGIMRESLFLNIVDGLFMKKLPLQYTWGQSVNLRLGSKARVSGLHY
jgi:hypothetical protein